MNVQTNLVTGKQKVEIFINDHSTILFFFTTIIVPMIIGIDLGGVLTTQPRLYDAVQCTHAIAINSSTVIKTPATIIHWQREVICMHN